MNLPSRILAPFGRGYTKESFVGDRNFKTATEVIEAANMDWDVKEVPLYVGDLGDPGHFLQVPDYRAIIREDNQLTLGIVGGRYTAVQNRYAFNFMDEMVNSGYMVYHSAGVFDGGRKIWILGLVSSMDIVTNDRVDSFILFHNSHDGSSNLTAVFLTMRAVCTNAILAAVRKGQGIALRHTRSIGTKLENAPVLISDAVKQFTRQQGLMQLAAKVTVSVEVFTKFVKDEVFPDPPEDAAERTKTMTENKRDKLVYLFNNGKGQDLPGVRETGWAAISAISEYGNWYKTVKGEDKDAKRIASALIGLNADWTTETVNTLYRKLNLAI